VVGGEFHMAVQVRIASSATARVLGSLTCDIHYGAALQEPNAEPVCAWSPGPDQGYLTEVVKLAGCYRILLTKDEIAFFSDSLSVAAAGGWKISQEWQSLVVLRWQIRQRSEVTVTLDERTCAAAFLEEPAPAQLRRLHEWQVACYSLGAVSLPIELSRFSAEPAAAEVLLKWTTTRETDHWGFHLFRAAEPNGPYAQITQTIIQSGVASADGWEYAFHDQTVQANKSYSYKLADVDRQGGLRFHGPVSVTTTQVAENSLEQNYPNPFNHETHIDFSLNESGLIELSIWNLAGQRVRRLTQQVLNPGAHRLLWDGMDEQGKPLASGIYLCRLLGPSLSLTRKIQLLR